MRIGLEDAMSRHSNSQAEAEAHSEAAMKAAQDYMAPATEAMQANVNKISNRDMQNDLRNLIKQGYITKGDFGWGSPVWVQEIFTIEHGLDKPRCDS